MPELAPDMHQTQTLAEPGKMPVTVVGLGKMGARIGAKLVRDGFTVYGWDENPAAREVAVGVGVLVPKTLEEAVGAQTQDGERVVWHMLPAGLTKEGLVGTSEFLSEGDIAIDGGNSRYTETERHAYMLGDLGLRFLGIGVSGGVKAGETGYPLMVGGDKTAYEHVTPILDSLAKPKGGHEYFGPGGAGHYVKMVHNGIEYPIMQAMGEGFGVLKASEYGLDIAKVAELFRKNTLVAGFMMDITAEALRGDVELSLYSGEIGSASGEALWTVEEAARLGVPTESIEQAIDFRRRSGNDPAVSGSFAAKVVAAQRATFGGHNQERMYIA